MKVIDVLTPQNLKLELKLATPWIRIGAFFVDQVIILLVGVVVLLLSVALESLNLGETFYQLLWLTVFAFYVFYSLIFEMVWNGQTPGKRLLSIRVIRMDGERVDTDEVVSRWIMRIPDLMLSAGSLAVLMISSSKYNQRVGDVLGGTIVVKENSRAEGVSLSHVLKLDTLASYEPSYPAVRHLSEDEAVLLKKVINRYEKHQNEGHLKAVQQMVNKMEEVLEIKKAEKNSIEFLRTLLKDYIVLTR